MLKGVHVITGTTGNQTTKSILTEWNQDLSMVGMALSEDEANRLGTEVTPESALTS